MQFLILRAEAEEEVATGLAGSGWSSTQYSVLDTSNPLLEYLQSERDTEGQRGREISSATSAALMASTFGF